MILYSDNSPFQKPNVISNSTQQFTKRNNKIIKINEADSETRKNSREIIKELNEYLDRYNNKCKAARIANNMKKWDD